MFKKIISGVALAIFAACVQPSTASAQAVEEGNILIDVYYGFPNLYGATFKRAYANSGTEENVKISSLGPIGLRGEYMVSDKIGLGLDIGFNNTKLTYTEFDSFDNKDYEYDFKTQKIGAMVTFNFHFLESNDNLDAYFMVGAGYGNRSFTFESTDPNYSDETIDGLIPVASRVGVGMRYFFTDNIGMNLAIGFGQGGLVNGGLSLKF
jgi:outer membrane protein W